MRHRSTIAFLMTLPLIILIVTLVAYPAGYAVYLAMLNKGMTRFVGLGNFEFLFGRDTFWMVVYQSCLFTFTAVFFKVIIGFVIAHFVHVVPTKGQRKWRGMLLVPWVIPPAMSTLAWRWLFDPSYSAINWILDASRPRSHLVAGRDRLGALLRHPGQRVVRRAVLHDHVPGVAEVGARAALRGGGDRRRHVVAAHPLRHPADDAQHHRHHRAVLPDRHLRRLRCRGRADPGRPARGRPRCSPPMRSSSAS